MIYPKKVYKIIPTNGGARKNFLRGPKQFFSRKNIRWEGQDEKNKILTHEITKNTLTGLGLGRSGPFPVP